MHSILLSYDLIYFTYNTYFTFYDKIGKVGIVDNNILFVVLHTTKNNFRCSFFLYSLYPYLEGILDAFLHVLKAQNCSFVHKRGWP